MPRVGVLFSVLAVQDSPAILVHFDAGDHNVASVDADGHRSTIRLVALHTVDVDDPFLAIYLSHFSLTTLVFAPDNPDLIIFPDGKGAAVVLATEFLGKTRRHNLAADGGRGGEVGLAGLPS